jgi:hypothetical protein
METTELNTYRKYCPNVFVARCPEQHEKGEIIILTTKYGKENEHEVHNFLGKDRDGYFLYSITRVDGYNAQERAKAKAERLGGYASNADKRSEEAYNSRASKTELEFLSLGEPIKVGHHSEKRHRKLFEKYDNKMRKSIEEQEKAEEYRRRAEYWAEKANDINLSMPESLEYYEFKLEEAKQKHQFYKDNPEKREHSFSLTYAKKAVNEAKNNLDLAVKLWGNEEEVKQVAEEKRQEAQAKAFKSKKKEDKIKSLGGFFAFNNDQFKEGYNKAVEDGHLEQGDKVTHVKAGLYLPSANVQEFLNS